MTTIISAVPANVIVDATAVVADANAIVFHDTAAVAAASTPAIVSAYSELEAIAIAKDTWETTVYRTSNDQLYALLQRCYGLYTLMCKNTDTAKQLVEDVDKYLAKKEYKVAPSSHTLAKIVKAVFGVDRRRVSAYSIALRAALAAKIAVADLPKFIRDNNGVEELRLAKSPNAKSPKQKADAAKLSIGESVIAKLKLDVLAGQYDEAKVGSQHVLIVTQGADGYFDLNALVSSDTALNAALAAFYTQNKAKVAAAAKDHTAENDDAAQAQRIKEAAVAALH
ncbi:hypothetical protein [Aestuariivirga sp.]|jgi:hypothetical protein|uniref:hypothetical protein n=1 Tax=Aestuariivirga sp. TaxID=2650926 RepID=UPI003782E5A4